VSEERKEPKVYLNVSGSRRNLHPSTVAKTLFAASIVPTTSLPADAIGLEELVFEDVITDKELLLLIKESLMRGEEATDGG